MWRFVLAAVGTWVASALWPCAWAGALTDPVARPYVRVHDPARPPAGPILGLRVHPRYTHTEGGDGPTWLIPGDRADEAHYRTRRVRLHLEGDIGRHWAYAFQWLRDAGTDEVEWYDAFVTYSGWRLADITVGQFPKPVDRLMDTGDIEIPLFERPRSSEILGGDRDVGIMVHDARRSGGRYAWYLGVFNGEGRNRLGNFRTMMWAGRFQWTVNRRLSVGVSFEANNNTGRSLYSSFLAANGDPYGWGGYYARRVMDELTWAVDAHWETEHFRVFAGYMRKDLDAGGASLPHASDWYVIGGWKVHCRVPEGLEVVLAYEDFDPNNAVRDGLDCRMYTVGVNWRPHGPGTWAGHFRDQVRVQYQWRDEGGPGVDNDSLAIVYELEMQWP